MAVGSPRHDGRNLVIAPILVAVATSGVRFMELSSGYRAYFDDDNPQLLALEALENTYAKSGNVLFAIVPRADDAMSERTLEATAWLTERAWQTPYSTRVDSLTDFQHTTADGDDLLICDLVDEAGPRDAAERSRIRAFALAEPAAARNPAFESLALPEELVLLLNDETGYFHLVRAGTRAVP